MRFSFSVLFSLMLLCKTKGFSQVNCFEAFYECFDLNAPIQLSAPYVSRRKSGAYAIDKEIVQLVQTYDKNKFVSKFDELVLSHLNPSKEKLLLGCLLMVLELDTHLDSEVVVDLVNGFTKKSLLDKREINFKSTFSGLLLFSFLQDPFCLEQNGYVVDEEFLERGRSYAERVVLVEDLIEGKKLTELLEESTLLALSEDQMICQRCNKAIAKFDEYGELYSQGNVVDIEGYSVCLCADCLSLYPNFSEDDIEKMCKNAEKAHSVYQMHLNLYTDIQPALKSILQEIGNMDINEKSKDWEEMNVFHVAEKLPEPENKLLRQMIEQNVRFFFRFY